MLARAIHAVPRGCLAALCAVVGIQGCGSDTSPTTPPSAGFSISIGASAFSVTQGTSTSTPVLTTRTGGFAAAVTYTVSGAPTGLTVGIANTTKEDSSTLNISASTGLVAGNYSLVLVANATGLASQERTFVVTVNAAVPTGTPTFFKSLVAGDAMSCVLTAVRTAYCWGLNANGQMGTGATLATNPVPVAAGGGLTFETLSIPTIGHFACGVAVGGTAYCWGANDVGQLGDSTTTQRLVPTPVAGGSKYLTISVGEHHACGLTLDSVAHCWGLNTYGALGDGTVSPRLTPVVAQPGMTFTSIVAGNDFTCGLTAAGAAHCWGLGIFGQLGNGDNDSSINAVAVSGGLTFSSLAAGGLDVCGLTASGAAYCWGHNFYGEVGDSTTTLRLAPVPVAGGHTFIALAGGFEHFCGVAVGGAAYCWGYNESGIIGDGTFEHRSSPSPVVGGFKFRDIAVGNGHACAITESNAASSNEVYCWGTNGNGELGDGTTTRSAGPFEVRFP